jgi:hypothetical protein
LTGDAYEAYWDDPVNFDSKEWDLTTGKRVKGEPVKVPDRCADHPEVYLSQIDWDQVDPEADSEPVDWMGIIHIAENVDGELVRDRYSLVLPLLRDAGILHPEPEQFEAAWNDHRGVYAAWYDELVGTDKAHPGHVLTAEEFDAAWRAAEQAEVPEDIDEPGFHMVQSIGGEVLTEEAWNTIEAIHGEGHERTFATVPAGEYFLGDPCYAVPNGDWEHLIKSWGDFATPIATLPDGTQVVAFHTAFGDGVYAEKIYDYRLPVDSGLIGLVPVTPVTEAALAESTAKLAERNGDGWYDSVLMRKVTFDHGEVLCIDVHGKLMFDGLTVDTTNYDLTPVFVDGNKIN